MGSHEFRVPQLCITAGTLVLPGQFPSDPMTEAVCGVRGHPHRTSALG